MVAHFCLDSDETTLNEKEEHQESEINEPTCIYGNHIFLFNSPLVVGFVCKANKHKLNRALKWEAWVIPLHLVQTHV